ncbi:iron-sulfur cluster assembly accessory protein [Candidatus Woesearchaeota archaeon]|nr:iron-sulfur cluster assembly accessory protein [Candidatus Woesearchaeota archaeon]
MKSKMDAECITKEMTIGEVVQKYPSAARIFTNYGLHCVGCHVSPMETIEQGALGHGMDEETLSEMIEEANKHLSDNPAGKAKDFDVKDAKIDLTDAAISKLKEIMKQEKKTGYFFRVAILPGGCSGFTYHFDLDEKPGDEDIVREMKGLKVVIDPESLHMMDGSRIDYIETLQAAGFKVDNPHAKSSCGCGHSFS